VELDEAIRRRRMRRRFSAAPVPPEVRDRLLRAALSAPSAGHSQGVDLLVLESETARHHFFDLTSDPAWRARVGGSAEGLLAAPLVVLPVADPAAYVARYAEPDKARSGLARLPAGAWPVPYWLVDASFATMLLLLGAAEAGLGALFFRLHRDPRPFLAGAGVPAGRLLIGAVALGWPHPEGERPRRAPPAPRRADRIHHDNW
jgi:nitroreductase